MIKNGNLMLVCFDCRSLPVKMTSIARFGRHSHGDDLRDIASLSGRVLCICKQASAPITKSSQTLPEGHLLLIQEFSILSSLYSHVFVNPTGLGTSPSPNHGRCVVHVPIVSLRYEGAICKRRGEEELLLQVSL